MVVSEKKFMLLHVFGKKPVNCDLIALNRLLYSTTFRRECGKYFLQHQLLVDCRTVIC